ncbi:VanZ family protein [Ruminococcaceae bacterium OttesenSCG-928-D13]|nr:VanZ family protein [Ruminococcaceae bacterium OttesenSCG-928-D13]
MAKTKPGTRSVLVKRALFTCISVACIIFIFINSGQSGTISGARSAAVTEFLAGIGLTLPDFVVRKFGHLAEYALLGLWLMLTLRAYTPRTFTFLGWPLLVGLLTGVLDEFNQLHVAGRSGEVTDVLIDMGGVLIGMALGLLLQWLAGIVSRRTHRRRAAKEAGN